MHEALTGAGRENVPVGGNSLRPRLKRRLGAFQK